MTDIERIADELATVIAGEINSGGNIVELQSAWDLAKSRFPQPSDDYRDWQEQIVDNEFPSGGQT